jgi:hypothetical protein
MLSPLEKRLILALGGLAWLAVMFVLVLKNLGGGIPPRPQLANTTAQANPAPRASQIDDLFSLASIVKKRPGTNIHDPFYPNITQPPVPAPPKTRIVDLIYRGCFTTSHGEKYAYVAVGDQLVVGGVGAKVVADWNVADIALADLTLKGPGTNQTVLPFDLKRSLEIPLP